MASNYIFLENNGIVVPDTANIKETVQQEFQAALGDNLSLEDSTPQGRLIDMETNARVNVIENNVRIANSINFNNSFGIILDAWGSNFDLERGVAKSSSVVATVTGVADTVIAAGSQASTQAGDVFYAENQIIIGSDGTATGRFLSVNKGAIPCAAGQLTKIIDGTLGWETITNTSPATLGNSRESDESYKQQFYDSGLFTGMSLVEDYENAITNVENVKSCYVRDNGESSSVVYDTVTIAAHSVYVCVDGGNNTDIADAIFHRKSGGCGYTAIAGQSVTENIIDETYGDTYTVTFNRPQETQIYVNVSANSGTSTSDNLENSIKNAVFNYINSLKIGADLLLLSLASAINTAVPGVELSSLTIGTSSDSLSSNNITIHINQVAKSTLTNITVTIND